MPIRHPFSLLRLTACATGVFGLLLTVPATAQVRTRITGPIDTRSVLKIPHSTHPLAKAENERGRVSGNLTFDRMLLVLKSSPEQQADLDQLLAEQQDPSSPNYMQWLTPAGFAERFGPSREDLESITNWLKGSGFEVGQVARGGRTVEFKGTASQVEAAFQTEMHHYEVNGQKHIANSTDLAIPAALAGVVGGVASLHDFRLKPLHSALGAAHVKTGQPLYNLSSTDHALTPYDFATIYNVTPLWKLGNTGAGQTIAIVARTNVNTGDMSNFRSTFGLPANPVNVIVNGPNPGIADASDEMEADLDVEWSGAVAAGATIDLVVSQSTAITDGILLSAAYIVNNNLASVMSTSYGNCEAALGTENAFFNSTWLQAAAEGISVFVSAGDSGSAGCDASSSSTPATGGLGVNGIASTPYNVAVGGTEFNDTANPSAYWNSSMSSNYSSALGYIPEMVWNQSGYSADGSSNNLYAGGGGVSSLYATPSWQTGKGVPTADPGTAAGHHRYLPDVSLNASTHDAYLVEQEGILYLVGGTSASSPSFAGLQALVDQYTGTRAGNPNPTLYSLGAGTATVFHDITTGSNAVPCAGGSSGCSATAAGTVGTLNGYTSTAGFDLASGWGSVDAYNLAINWKAVPAGPIVTSLGPNPFTGSSSAKTLTINGTGFAAGTALKVVLTPSSSGSSVITVTGSQVTFVSAKQLTVSVVLGTTAQTWGVVVTNPSGQASNSALLTVGAPPAIGSLSPNPMLTSSSNQSLTITGTGFESGAQVVLTAAGKTTTLSGSSITSISATQLKVTVNVGTTAQTWTVQVVNPDGGASATASLTVAAPPAIASLSPNPMTASSANQTLTIAGTGFLPGAEVLMTAAGKTTTLSGSSITSTSATQLQVTVNVGTTLQTWTVELVNSNGGSSATASLTVSAPPPAITSLSPNPMAASSANQTLTINGTGFQSGGKVLMTAAGKTTTLSGSSITSTSATQLKVTVNVGTTAQTWTVQVQDPAGANSAAANLTVTAPPPAITSLSPTALIASSANQTLTINGTGFQSGAEVLMTAGGKTTTLSGSSITSTSATQLKVTVNVGTAAQTWTVQVVNPGGITSAVANLIVSPGSLGGLLGFK